MTLSGKHIVVTGAFRGIGAACAIRLASEGAYVTCADIHAPIDTVKAIGDTGGEALSRVCDVGDEAAVVAFFAGLERPLDCLVHCAGVILEKSLLDTTADDFDHVISTNLRGSFLVGREAVRAIGGGKGRVVMIASDMAHYGRESFSAYVASKHGVLGLVRSWAKECAPDILVNAICPGPIETDMLDAGNMSPEWRRKELDIPLARFGQPEEVATLACFLVGPGAEYITGQGLGINGGSVM